MSDPIATFRRRVHDTALRGGREIRLSLREAMALVDAMAAVCERLATTPPTDRAALDALGDALRRGDDTALRQAAERLLLGRGRTPTEDDVLVLDVDPGGFRK